MANHPSDDGNGAVGGWTREATVRNDDGRLPAPRRAGLPLFRRTSPTPVSADPNVEPRIADLSFLLADIDQLRTILSTDLSLAAAALEAGAADVATQLVAGDLHELGSFEARALSHLASLEAPASTVDQLDLPLARRRRGLPAAPLVAAAAAAIGLFIGVVPDRIGLDPSTTPTSAYAVSQASHQLAELAELAELGASTTELRVAAQQLNDKFADLVAGVKNDPVAAQQAWLLLRAGTQVLSEQADQGALSAVLARTRELERELRKVLPRTLRTTAPGLPILPPERRSDTRAPNGQPAAATPRPSAGSSASSTVKSSPSPSPTAAPAPTAGPSPTPRRTPSPSGSPAPRTPTAGPSSSPAPLPQPPRVPET